MLDFRPDTTIYLCRGVPLVNDYHSTIDFPNEQAQYTYFMRMGAVRLSGLTFQRETGAIRAPIPYEKAIGYNYCLYQNRNFGTKWFYAFITDFHYVNPEMTELEIELDVMQTWLFDYQVLSAFIEREHTKSDYPFQHNIPEGLEFGPIKVGYAMEKPFWNMCICIAYSAGATESYEKGELIEGVYSGLKYQYFDATTEGVNELNRVLESLSSGGHLEDVVSVFMVPEAIAKGWATNFYMDTAPVTVDGYTPRNNKLFSYPYRYLAVDNYMGQENIYRFDLFRNPFAIWFNIAHQFNMEAAAYAYPMDYAGMEENWNEGISLSDFPLCTWVGNVYANWAARNKYSRMANYALQGANVVSGALRGDVAGATGALAGIVSQVAQETDRSLYPYHLQGQQANGTVNIPYQKTGFLFSIKVITAEYAKIIDDFFTRFGYKVNRNGIPDTKTRRWWNYVKTSECKVSGSLPQRHIRKIEEVYNQGVTFWHDPDEIDNYDNDNYCLDPGPEPDYPAPTIPPEPPDYKPVTPTYGWGYPAVGWSLKGISSGYGWRIHPTTGKKTFHYGVDIPLPSGTALLAMHAGTVDQVNYNEYRGWYVDVIADGNEELKFRYQHCLSSVSQIAIVGEHVDLEQRIADSGYSGDVYPPGERGAHVHIEMFKRNASGNWENIDPTPYILPNYG